MRILDGAGRQAPPGKDGVAAIRLRLPPGTLTTLWNDDERYISSYLSAYDGDVAGHHLSSGALEEVLSGHPEVVECAVIGVRDERKGQVPRAFVVLKAGVDRVPQEICAELVNRVHHGIGAVASLRRIDIVSALPKTRSDKILRRTMRDIADGVDCTPPPPSTIPRCSNPSATFLRNGSSPLGDHPERSSQS
ncbi:AMP-binding enzyme [Streptomyces malaysiensis]|uniref:AMP-binding enzyme n=1 Tax=Streptomyces malaysiensis TaxID=92644 RepID=UPI0028150790|nr:hypothetical protein [Streptomyces samsunensis]